MFYIINKTTRQLYRQSQTPFNIDETKQPEGDVIQLKQVIDASRPTHNPDTEKLVESIVDNDVAFTRTFRLVVAPLSAPEIAAVTQRNADETNRLQIKAVIADLRNGVGTAVERLTRLEKAVAYLLREEVRR